MKWPTLPRALPRTLPPPMPVDGTPTPRALVLALAVVWMQVAAVAWGLAVLR